VRISLLILGILASWFVLVAAGAQSSREGADTFVLSVDRQGLFSVPGDGNGLRLNESSVVEQAVAALRRDAATTYVVEADEGAPYESVKRAALLLQEAGATWIAFRTTKAAQP
jgi:biopolymer transport protein ExbD